MDIESSKFHLRKTKQESFSVLVHISSQIDKYHRRTVGQDCQKCKETYISDQPFFEVYPQEGQTLEKSGNTLK